MYKDIQALLDELDKLMRKIKGVEKDLAFIENRCSLVRLGLRRIQRESKGQKDGGTD